MSTLAFTKMHALGNDFVVLDGIVNSVKLSPALIAELADRRRGIGFDQLLLLERSDKKDVKFLFSFFNTDGSASNQCGNGARCLGYFLLKNNHVELGNVISVGLKDGRLLELKVSHNAKISVNMGVACFEASEIGVRLLGDQTVSCLGISASALGCEQFLVASQDFNIHIRAVSMGNPHAVVWQHENAWLSDELLESKQPSLLAFIFKQLNKKGSQFIDGVNVSFVKMCDQNVAQVLVYERGVGQTQACGSAACAILACSEGLKKLSVQMPGGCLLVGYDQTNNIWLEGEVAYVFEGSYMNL